MKYDVRSSTSTAGRPSRREDHRKKRGFRSAVKAYLCLLAAVAFSSACPVRAAADETSLEGGLAVTANTNVAYGIRSTPSDVDLNAAFETSPVERVEIRHPGSAELQETAPVQESGPAAPLVVRARIDDDAITPVTLRYLSRVFREATEQGAEAVIVQLDTPGGLVQSTREIVQEFLASPLPIIVYVSPSGSRAASAGVFITMASHVAAMAPGTHIGAAHPVQIGGAPGSQPADTVASPMDEKILEDARAWARSLANLRGRNADWAESAVVESRSITAEEAVELNVVEILAVDMRDLLQQLHGRDVPLEARTVTLNTADAQLVPIDPWWGERLLGTLSNPNVAFILLILGFYGILFEFYSPGWGVAGTVGALSLLLGFFGLAVLPVNFVGLLLVLAGLGLFVAEAFVPSFGALTVGGVIALILGGLMLIDSPFGVVQVSLSVVVPIAIGTGLITLFLMTQIVRAHRGRLQTGAETMVGTTVVAAEDFTPSVRGYAGMVHVRGELWTGLSESPLKEGDRAYVKAREGLKLHLEPDSKPV